MHFRFFFYAFFLLDSFCAKKFVFYLLGYESTAESFLLNIFGSILKIFLWGAVETYITHNMTTLGPSRGISKRSSQVNNRVKIDVVDIHSPPPGSYDLEKSSGSTLLQVSQRTSVSMNSQRIHITGPHRCSAAPSKNGPNSSVIDVEEIEDEVQLLSSSKGFQQVGSYFCFWLLELLLMTILVFWKKIIFLFVTGV